MNILKDQRTNRKYILIVFIFATIVGGGILGYQYLFTPKGEPVIPTIKSSQKKIPPFIPFLINCEETPQYCAEVGDLPSPPQPSKGEWYYAHAIELAIQNNDPSFCNLVIDRFIQDLIIPKESAEEDCQVGFAIKTEDLEYCLTLRQKPAYRTEIIPRDQCLEPLAKKLKKLDLCDLLIKEHWQGGVEYSRTDCKIAIDPSQDYLSADLDVGTRVLLTGTMVDIGSREARLMSNNQEIILEYSDPYSDKSIIEKVSEIKPGERVKVFGMVRSDKKISVESIQKL